MPNSAEKVHMCAAHRLKGTQDWDFFGFDLEICIISLLVMSKYWDFTKKIFWSGHFWGRLWFFRVVLKVSKCKILISWILMIFYHEVYIGRGLKGWNKIFTFFTDGWDTGHFVIATACAVYASKLLSYAPSTLAKCYRLRRTR